MGMGSQLLLTGLSTFPEPRPLEKRVGDYAPVASDPGG
ncbi:MAG: hypothetical protein QOH35_3500, partial [Acidobacteriaceae bacterium]|nr:hypothetical protein [Acidobacteriaceae bacterium]